MINDNVYYINIKPYVYDLDFNEIYKRFLKSNIGRNLIEADKTDFFIRFMNKNIKMYHFDIVQKNKDDYNVDGILSKRILHHLKDFFDKK